MRKFLRQIFYGLIGAVYAIALIWVVAYRFKQPELAFTVLIASISFFICFSITLWVFDKSGKKEKLKV